MLAPLGMSQASHGIPADQQRLMFGGVHLEDHRNLEHYHIPAQSTLQLLLRLR